MDEPNGQPELGPAPMPGPGPEPVPEPGQGPEPVPTSMRATILSNLEDGKSAAPQTEITHDAIAKAHHATDRRALAGQRHADDLSNGPPSLSGWIARLSDQ